MKEFFKKLAVVLAKIFAAKPVQEKEEDIEKPIELEEPARPPRDEIEVEAEEIHNSKHRYWWKHYDYVKKGPKIETKGRSNIRWTKYSTPSGFPIMLIVHYTAGWNTLRKAISTLKNTKYAFWCMDIDGTIYQPENMPLDHGGYHAGESGWIVDGKRISGVSKISLGLEINNGGLLRKIKGVWQTWFKKEVPELKRRTVKLEGNRYAGTYEVYSDAQEQTLRRFIKDLAKNDKDFRLDLVLGHDEVSGPRGIGRHRKQDPGGALSVTMDQLRKEISIEFYGQGSKKPVKPPVLKERSRLKEQLRQNSPQLSEETIKNFSHWATTEPRVTNRDHAVLIDMKKRSSLKRFYIIDLKTGKTIAKHKTAHGKNSDPNHDGYIDSYSNVSGSNKSSMGAMLTGVAYGNREGGGSKFPYARRLHGLEPGINDNVFKRAIVFHSSSYVDDTNDRISGRSLGCPAVDDDVAKEIQKYIVKGTLFYIADDRFQ